MGFCREGKGHVGVESRRESFYVHWRLDLDEDEDVKRPDLVPLDRHWEQSPYPEFPYEDLENLIAVLVDLRDNDKRYKEWLSQRVPECSDGKHASGPGDYICPECGRRSYS